MNTAYIELKKFLINTDDIKSLCKSDAIIWIDWREDDEAVISYINQHLEEESQMGHFVDTDEDADVNIVLMNTKEKGVLPTKTRTIFNPESRDTTLKEINAFIQPQNDIRWFMESLGNDTLAFFVLKNSEWQMLEDEFGKEKVDYYFSKIKKDSVMFDLDMNEVFYLLEKRKNKF